jgi:hypothetical protein
MERDMMASIIGGMMIRTYTRDMKASIIDGTCHTAVALT